MEDTGDAGSELIRLWRVYRTVRQMLADRVCLPILVLPWAVG